MGELRNTFISGVVWGTIEKFASLFVGFFITLLLARKLTPTDYGLVNMINIFTVFGMVLIDGGFGQALIQKKNADNKDYSTIFYLNVILSVLIYVILYICAPFIAAFYAQPSLIDISRTIFLLFPINAFCIIQHTLLTKEIKVKQLTIVSLISSVCSGVVGMFFAYKGYGVWALVYQTLSLYVFRCITLWLVNSWRPIMVFSLNTIKEIWKFSVNLLGTFTLAAIFQNIYSVLIGKFFCVTDVGYYNQAFRMESVVTGVATSAIQRVTFPAFANIQDDIDRLREVYKKVINVTMYIHLPIMAGIAAVGYDLFLVLLTEKWLPSVPYFYLLCLASSFYPMHMVNVNVIKALSKGKLYFRLNVIKYMLMTLFIIFTIQRSIMAVLGGYVLATIISSFIITCYCGRQIKYSTMSQLLDLFPIFLITLAMVAAVLLCGNLSFLPHVRLLIEILMGIVVYVILSVIFKLEAFKSLLAIVRNK